jgi:hypothetical protein
MRAVEVPAPSTTRPAARPLDDPRRSSSSVRAFPATRPPSFSDSHVSTTSMRAAEENGKAPEDYADDEMSPRLMRVQRKRKRKKRLSLTTSPGMLSSIDPAALNDADDDLPDGDTIDMELPETISALRREREERVKRERASAMPNAGTPIARIAVTSAPSSARGSTAAPATPAANGSTAAPSNGSIKPDTALLAVDTPFTRSDRSPAKNGAPSPTPALPATTAGSAKPPLPEAALGRPPAPPPLLAKVVAESNMERPRPIEVKPPPIAAQARIASSRADDATALIDVRETRSTDDWRAPTLRPTAVRKPVALYAVLFAAAAILLFAWIRSGSTPDANAHEAKPAAATPTVTPESPAAVNEAPAAPAEAPAAALPEQPPTEPSEPAALAATTPTETNPEPVPSPEPPTPVAPAAEGGGDAIDAAAVLERARKLDEQNKPKQALAVYEEAAQRLPVNSTVLGRLAFAYLNRGRDADAVQYAEKAVGLDPTNSEGWIVLGAGKFQLGDRKAAKDAYKRCAEQGKGPYVAECKRLNR